MLSIATSCVPSQNATRQSVVAPNQFSSADWRFSPTRTEVYNWQSGVAITSNDNYFAKAEPYQKIKNSMFNPLTGQEPIYGQVNYTMNPALQEQTNSHMSGYSNQLQTRVRDNMSPAGVMRAPVQLYPVGHWINSYQGASVR